MMWGESQIFFHFPLVGDWGRHSLLFLRLVTVEGSHRVKERYVNWDCLDVWELPGYLTLGS